jgi:predicted DNA-binding transcriptional regulator YafY
MSYRAITQRMHFIHRRLKYKRDYPSAPVLARDWAEEAGDEVSSRTIKRDIELLRDEGAPIEYEAARHGYYYTDEAYDLPAMLLTEGDLLGILVADRALSAYRNTPFHQRLAKVFKHLVALLPEQVSVSSQDLAEEISVITDPVTTIAPRVWDALQEGLSKQRTVTVSYRAPGHENAVKRRIDPYHLIGYRGEWYLLGYSHHDDEVRVYALGRMTKCAATAGGFTRPDGFDAATYIDPAIGIYVNEETINVAIRFERAVADKIRERVWHPGQQIEQDTDGAIILRYPTNQQSQTLFWVSQWGPNAEILEPEELRRQAADWFAKTAGRYKGRASR